MLTLIMAGLVMLAVPFLDRMWRIQIPAGVPAVPWWGMAGLFFLGELAVVHFRLRRDAHSFSISEIATVLGLYLAGPVSIVIGQLLGGVAALLVGRRQRGIRVAFNGAVFALQTVVVALVFHLLVDPSNPLGGAGAVGAWLGGLMALGVATVLITMAIRITGGTVASDEIAEVLRFGALGTTMNVGLGLVAITIIWERPQSAWLAAVPVGLLFVAFRGYMGQRDQRSRTEALYDLTFELHRSPVIDDAVKVAAEGIRRLFEVTAVHIIVIPEPGGLYALRTTASVLGPTDVMAPVTLPTSGRWSYILKDAFILPKLRADELPVPGQPAPGYAMTAPVGAGDKPMGLVIVADPLSTVSGFTARDLKMLETIASRLAVSLENGRLEDSLAELTRLKERLEALIRSKDQFLASVSHELRTPLTGIVGLAQELNRSREMFSQDEVDEFMGMIFEQSTELANIVEDLLVAARADIGTLVIRPVRVDLVSEAETVLFTYLKRSERDNIQPKVRGLETALAEFDPLRFRQILRNLITNAVRYGGENIWVEVERRGARFALIVADDGAGVPAAFVDDIFEPYTRASNSMLNPQSVGLGLSVSRALARLMGGDLVYEPGEAVTRFVLLLPAADSTSVIRTVTDEGPQTEAFV